MIDLIEPHFKKVLSGRIQVYVKSENEEIEIISPERLPELLADSNVFQMYREDFEMKRYFFE